MSDPKQGETWGSFDHPGWRLFVVWVAKGCVAVVQRFYGENYGYREVPLSDWCAKMQRGIIVSRDPIYYGR